MIERFARKLNDIAHIVGRQWKSVTKARRIECAGLAFSFFDAVGLHFCDEPVEKSGIDRMIDLKSAAVRPGDDHL